MSPDSFLPTAAHLLIVDDNPANLDLLSQIFEDHPFEVRAVRDATTVLKGARAISPDLILLDIRMPVLNGFEVCALLKADPQTKDIPVIFISAADDLPSKLEAFRAGGVDYITKPFQPEEVLARVNTHLMLQQTRRELRRANQALTSLNQELEQRVAIRTSDLNEAYLTTIYGWARTLELRDFETKGHCERVTEIACQLGSLRNLSSAELIHLQRGAILHDIGKIGIPDSILLKPGPLNPEEWEIVRLHPVYGYDLLKPVKFLKPALDVVLSHHERWDGLGYPNRLKGEQIPISARIFSIIDVWDALRSVRPYKNSWSIEETSTYLSEQSGTQFDPSIVPLFLNMIQQTSS